MIFDLAIATVFGIHTGEGAVAMICCTGRADLAAAVLRRVAGLQICRLSAARGTSYFWPTARRRTVEEFPERGGWLGTSSCKAASRVTRTPMVAANQAAAKSKSIQAGDTKLDFCILRLTLSLPDKTKAEKQRNADKDEPEQAKPGGYHCF